MSSLFYIAFTFFLFAVSMIYHRLANIYQIVDLPNHRTMHQGATIRGGGVVILFAMVLATIFLQYPGYYFLAGLLIIGITGFVDDLVNLPGKVRFPFQLIAVLLLLMELDFFQYPWHIIIVVVVVATGVLNAFNFMDGINGMTAGYTVVLAISLVFINEHVQQFVEKDLLYCYLVAVVVFGFFNFRKKAVCFAGDVGSLTIAFINVYLILKLISASGHWIYIFFLALYGIDTIFTIIQRLANRENIFEAHNKHFFQVAVRHMGITHIQMSVLYMVIQSMVNALIIFVLPYSLLIQWFVVLVMLGILSGTYIFMKFRLLKTSG